MAIVADARLPPEVTGAIKRNFSSLSLDQVRPVEGGSQVSVWRVTMLGVRQIDLAVRLVRRPIDLLKRQAEALAVVHAAGAPVSRILAIESIELPDGPACVEIMEWVSGRHPRPSEHAHARAIGVALARLHRTLAGLEDRFPDRPLKLDTFGGYMRQLKAAGNNAQSLLRVVERHQKSLRSWDEYYGVHLPSQLIHGDMHEGNVIILDCKASFIDFDKMMVGPRVFDLAKFISTSCFESGHEARLARRSVDELLEGYSTVERLRDAEIASLIPLCMILNAESALCGFNYDLPDLVQRAGKVGHWWISKEGRGRLSQLRRIRQRPHSAQQLALFGATG